MARPAMLTALLVLVPMFVQGQDPLDYDPDLLGTYSIIARDAETGELGVGVQSKAFGAGNRAMHAKGGAAVIAHQASANPMYGAIGLQLLDRGYSPEDALDMMVGSDDLRDRRQVAILDAEGRTAAWTGASTSDWAGHQCGVDYCAQGNIIAGPEVVEAMAESFLSSEGPLAERLMDALDAAQEAGGDVRGMQSGAILVVRPPDGGTFRDQVVDIRVDDHPEPLRELRRVLNVQRSNERVSEAGQLLAAGELGQALEVAESARDLSPENDRVWIGLASVYLELDRTDDALAALREAVEVNPWNRDRLPANDAFAELHGNPDFQSLISPR